jgi:hypothetical protein
MPKQVPGYTVLQFQRDYREGKYTSVGSYPKYWFSLEGLICYDCIKANYITWLISFIGKTRSLLGCQVNWESPEEYCCKCENRIESAYAEPSEE